MFLQIFLIILTKNIAKMFFINKKKCFATFFNYFNRKCCEMFFINNLIKKCFSQTFLIVLTKNGVKIFFIK
jgi:hypothetical protein